MFYVLNTGPKLTTMFVLLLFDGPKVHSYVFIIAHTKEFTTTWKLDSNDKTYPSLSLNKFNCVNSWNVSLKLNPTARLIYCKGTKYA